MERPTVKSQEQLPTTGDKASITIPFALLVCLCYLKNTFLFHLFSSQPLSFQASRALTLSLLLLIQLLWSLEVTSSPPLPKVSSWLFSSSLSCTWLTIKIAAVVAGQDKNGGSVGLAGLEHYGVFRGPSLSHERATKWIKGSVLSTEGSTEA